MVREHRLEGFRVRLLRTRPTGAVDVDQKTAQPKRFREAGQFWNVVGQDDVLPTTATEFPEYGQHILKHLPRFRVEISCTHASREFARLRSREVCARPQRLGKDGQQLFPPLLLGAGPAHYFGRLPREAALKMLPQTI